jgi:hypothetical protein
MLGPSRSGRNEVEGLFQAALAMPDVDQRRVFLDEACPDAEQRRRVEALLRAYHDAGNFLEAPAAGREGVPHDLDVSLPDEVPLDFLHPSDQPGCLGTLGPYQIIDVIEGPMTDECFRRIDAPDHLQILP